MVEKEDIKQHYKLPLASDLENKIAREYKVAFAKIPSFLEDFGDFLFPLRIPSEDLKDSHESRGATDVYDEQLLELYALSLAKAEIAASEATPETATSILDKILGEQDDLFLSELNKKSKWQSYLSPECIAAWYDDKRRAALRGLARKGITLQEKLEEKPESVSGPQPGRFRLLYGLTIANTFLLAALTAYAVIGSIYGISVFQKEKQSLELEMDMKEKAYIHQFYEFADKIDPPKDDNDKEKKRKIPLPERVMQVLKVYEQRLIDQGENRYRKVSAADYQRWGDDFIKRLENGEVDFDKIMEAYFRKKMEGK
ncbi:hypothetical protein KY338_03745 [Candidatus Woesearchaeota archaeon]|nr:hypothetical protein [Candidatus Woesearchaeota archaeon]MBW3005425.1 hypothetical protein [Candidatus Woesearchaeota archaeon]